MTLESRLDDLVRGWRGPLLAALVALAAGLPVVLGLPPLDRGEARIAQATAQALESHDFVDISFQDEPADRTPAAIHWLQAVSVSALSSVETRHIWAYRIPSLLGAMLAAAACAWGAAAFFRPGTSAMAGALLGASFLLSTEAGVADTGAVLCGAVTVAMGALARLYGASAGGAPAGVKTKVVFWLGLTLAVLVGGLTGGAMIALTALALWAWDRRAPWARSLGWGWGAILLVAAIGPWVVAITVRTDGQIWFDAAAGLTRWVGPFAPPGLHSLLTPILMFPAAALLPAALVGAWKGRFEPGPHFALCWLAPAWLVAEFSPVKLVGDTLPLYGALAWLAADAVTRPIGRASRISGAAISAGVGLLLAVAFGVAGFHYSVGATGIAATIVTCALALAAGAAGAAVVAGPDRFRLPALAAASGLAIAAHGAAAGAAASAMKPLWLSPRVVAVLNRSGLNPQDGLTPGPVTVVGYSEPSLVFALGTETELGDADLGAEAISEGRPVVVEQHDEAAFHKDLADGDLKATAVGTVAGLDYSLGKLNILTIYRSDSPPSQEPPTEMDPDGQTSGADRPSKDKP